DSKMQREYKRILLVVGLENLTDEELQRLKFFLPDELKISKGKLAKANRTEVADMMIQSTGITSVLSKTISIFKKLNYRSPEKKRTVAQQDPARKEGVQKDPLTVTVLKAMKPFEFKTHGGKQKMFHATVANEEDFFLVKVFNMELQDKFTPKKIIVISNYHWHSQFLEVNSTTYVCDAESDQQMSIPQRIKRKAGETPKINKLQTKPLGTIVNGLFIIQKKKEKKDRTAFELNDNTGMMEVLVFGEQKMIHCEEGDKLRLTFFELSKSGKNLQLKSGDHSFIEVGTPEGGQLPSGVVLYICFHRTG
ncbi:Interferon-inducible protein AIM2, partial [Galemys pyrenaicus]